MPNPLDPQAAWQGASTIGPSRVGERYVPTGGPQSLLDLVTRYVMGGEARPQLVAAQDPTGMQAFEKGAGNLPMLGMMGSTEELSPLSKALFSRVSKVAEGLPEQAHPAKALSLFKNHASKEEMDYRGLTQLLTERQGPAKISKAEILDHLAKNPVPDVRVKTLGTTPTRKVHWGLNGSPIW
jgi:hypothetical protein